MTSADPISDLKNELSAFYKAKGEAWAGKLWATKFYSDTMADKDNVMAQATDLVQKAGSKTGGSTAELQVPCAMAQVMLCSCRSEQLSNMTRIQCMAAVLNEAMTMQNLVVNKLDGMKR